MPAKRSARRPGTRKARAATASPRTKAPVVESERAPAKVDGRARRATGRTLRFGATVHPDWKAQLDRLADRMGTMYVQVLERALDLLENELDQEEAKSRPTTPARKTRKGGTRKSPRARR